MPAVKTPHTRGQRLYRMPMDYKVWSEQTGWTVNWTSFVRWIYKVQPEDDAEAPEYPARLILHGGVTRRSLEEQGQIDCLSFSRDDLVQAVQEEIQRILSEVPPSKTVYSIQISATRAVPPSRADNGETEDKASGQDPDPDDLPPEDEDTSLGEDDDGEENEDEDDEGEEGDEDGEGALESDYEEVPWPEMGVVNEIFTRIIPAQRTIPAGAFSLGGVQPPPQASPPPVSPQAPPPREITPVTEVQPVPGPGPSSWGGSQPNTPAPTPAAGPPQGGPAPTGGTQIAQVRPQLPSVPGTPATTMAFPGGAGFDLPEGMIPLPNIPMEAVIANPNLGSQVILQGLVLHAAGEQRHLLRTLLSTMDSIKQMHKDSLDAMIQQANSVQARAETAQREAEAARVEAARKEIEVERVRADERAKSLENRLGVEGTNHTQVVDLLREELNQRGQELLAAMAKKDPLANLPTPEPRSPIRRLGDKVAGMAEMVVDQVAKGVVEGASRAPDPAGQWKTFRGPDGKPFTAWVPAPGSPMVPPAPAPTLPPAPQPQQPQQYPQGQPQPFQQQPPAQGWGSNTPPGGPQGPWGPQPQWAPPPAPAPSPGGFDISSLLADPGKIGILLSTLSEEQQNDIVSGLIQASPELAVEMARKIALQVQSG